MDLAKYALICRTIFPIIPDQSAQPENPKLHAIRPDIRQVSKISRQTEKTDMV
jgi:hypothetical protein